MKKFFLLFMIISILSFVMLGFWQLYRLQWKSDLIKAAKENSSLEPLVGLKNPITQTMLFTHIKFEGQTFGDKKIFVVESYNKKYVYRLLAPVLIDGKTIVVDFGLIDSKNITLPNKFSSVGILLSYDRKNIFYPSNNPSKDLWFNLDLESIKQFFNINIEPYYIKIAPNHSILKEATIKKFATSYRNDHLMYAITWFALGIFCSIILYFRLKE
jgi:surfeit locus 1 family protein